MGPAVGLGAWAPLNFFYKFDKEEKGKEWHEEEEEEESPHGSILASFMLITLAEL
jgi:hypothetical protein